MISINDVKSILPTTDQMSTNKPGVSNFKGRQKPPRKYGKTAHAADEEILISRLNNTRVRLNVGGEVHEVMWKTLRRMPFTRLGLLRKALTHNQIMELCDDYDLQKNEYYFDRHPKSFLCVLTMFRSGNLHMLEDLCIINFAEDLDYWGINENLMESCCHHRFHMKKERINDEIKKIKDINAESNPNEIFGPGILNKFRSKLWDLMENPQTSIAAQIVAVISVLFILISIVCLTVSTLPLFAPNDHTNKTNNTMARNSNFTASATLENIEIVCISWFTFEYVCRMMSCPDMKMFLKSPMNMIDILAIFPYYVSVIFTKVFHNEMESLVSVRKVVQVFRILRVLRILKLARHSTGLQALGYTLQKSYKELGMLVMFIALGVLLFSSLIYFVEREENGVMFSSIPATFWWAIITMTTVGYGDMVPKTSLGKFIGSFCCICGVLVIALPIPIIVNNFADYYKDQLRREKTLKRKEDMAKARQHGSIVSTKSDDESSDESVFTDEERSNLMKSSTSQSQSLKPQSLNNYFKGLSRSSLSKQSRNRSESVSEIHSHSHIHKHNDNYSQPHNESTLIMPKSRLKSRQRSVPLLHTQAYQNVMQERRRKMNRKSMEKTRTDNSYQMMKRSSSVSNNTEEKDTIIQLDNNENNDGYFKRLMCTILPNSYSSSHITYVPTRVG